MPTPPQPQPHAREEEQCRQVAGGAIERRWIKNKRGPVVDALVNAEDGQDRPHGRRRYPIEPAYEVEIDEEQDRDDVGKQGPPVSKGMEERASDPDCEQQPDEQRKLPSIF